MRIKFMITTCIADPYHRGLCYLRHFAERYLFALDGGGAGGTLNETS